jgi:hypothetical protein
MERATSFVALARSAWAEAMTGLDRGANRVGLSAEGRGSARTASVWPVIGAGFLVIALIADRIHSAHAVPVRWLVVLLIFGAVVVAGQLREGGRLPVLNAVPAVLSSSVLLTGFALLLAAQQVDFLSLGVTQVAWFLALVCVVVPLVRDARRHEPPASAAVMTTGVGSIDASLSALRQSAPLFGALLTVVAIIVGWLPGQYGPGWFWTVVLLLAAGLAVATEIAKLPAHRFTLPDPLPAAGFWVLTALVAGVAVASARLEVTSVIWLVAAYVLVREAWRRLPAEGGRLRLRSRYGIALAGLAVALFSLFGTTNSLTTGGYFMGGLSYDPYSYDADSEGFAYNPTEYYEPGFYFESSGRGQPFSIPVIAGLVAMAGLVRRRRITARVRAAAIVVSAGAVVWIAVEGSTGYLSVWVFIISMVVAGAATAVSAWPERLSASLPRSSSPQSPS